MHLWRAFVRGLSQYLPDIWCPVAANLVKRRRFRTRACSVGSYGEFHWLSESNPKASHYERAPSTGSRRSFNLSLNDCTNLRLRNFFLKEQYHLQSFEICESTYMVQDEDTYHEVRSSMRRSYERVDSWATARSDAQTRNVPEIVRYSGILPEYSWSV